MWLLPSSIAALPSLLAAACLALVVAAFVVAGGIAEAEDPDYGNDAANAHDISVGSPVDGTLGTNTDVDFFKIDLTSAAEDVDLWVYVVSAIDTVVTLHDSTPAEIVQRSNGFLRLTGRNPEVLIHEALTKGSVYYLSVAGVAGAMGDYTLHTEQSVNLPVDTNTSAQALIDDADDFDFFHLDLSAKSGTFDAWVYSRATTTVDTLGILLDNDEGVVDFNDDSALTSGEGDFQISLPLTPGHYYLAVAGVGTEMGPYALHAETDYDVGSRIRDVKDDANALLTLNTPRNGIIGTGGDQDTYKLDLSSKTTDTDVIFYTETDGLDTIGALFDDVGGQIDEVDDSELSPGSTDFFIGETLEPGIYYIAVVAFGDSVGPYRLHVKEVSDASTAITIDSTTGAGSAVGVLREGEDSDTFTFSGISDKDVFVYSLGPVDTVGEMGSLKTDDGELSPVHRGFFLGDRVTTGTVTVKRLDKNEAGPYRVVVETADDQGESTTGAADLALNTPVFGLIASGTDVDWFKLVLADATELLLFTTGYTDTKATLYESDGTTEVSSDDDTGVGFNFLIKQSLASGTYYLKVEGFDSTEAGPYALFAETVFSLALDPTTIQLEAGAGRERISPHHD